MNLVFYSPRFLPQVGGLERVVWLWATALTHAGHAVTVITGTPAAEPDSYPFAVLRRASLRRKVACMRGADVVVQVNISLKGLPLLWLAGKPLIVSHHTLLTNGPYRWRPQQQLKCWLCNRLAKINICCSAYVAAQFARRAVVVHSPYDAAQFRQLGLPRKPKSVLFVGRLVSDKGADLLLRAFGELLPVLPDAQLTICGSGPEQQALVMLCHNLGISGSVHFEGVTSGQKLVQLMNTAAVLVVPSRVEPFGTVVAEGLACGALVITSDAGGLPEAGGDCATVVHAGSPTALALSIRQLLKQQEVPEPAGLSQFLASLTPDHTAQKLMHEIETILAK